MSSEVCPFCGKSFKRLKSHLPHCKAAANAKKSHLDGNEKVSSASSLQLGTDTSEMTAEGKRSEQILRVTRGENKRSKMTSAPAAPASSSSSSLSCIQSTKKKKQKQADQIKTATPPLSTPAPGYPSPGSRPVATTSRNTAQTKTGSDSVHATFRSTDTEQKGSAKKILHQTKASLDSLPSSRGEKEEICGNEVLWKSGGGDQDKITLQDVKTILGRTKNSHRNSRGSIFKHSETTTTGKNGPNTFGNEKEVSLVKRVAQSDLLKCSAKEPDAVNRSNPAPPEPICPGVFSNHLSCELSQDSITHTSSMKEGMKMDHLTMGLLSVTPPVNQFLEALPPSSSSSTRLLPHLPVEVETAPSEEKQQFDVRKPNTVHHRNEGVFRTRRPIGDVTLRELPDWLACRTPRRPRDVLEMAQKGWRWYYRRYIDVRKGGVGGLGMLLAGYCVLSYIWSYPHLKRDRWRKYH